LAIQSSRVDLEISLFCLRNRKFEAARPGFEKILPSVHSGQFFSADHFNVVNKIIKILKGSFNLRIDELEVIHVYLVFRLSCNLIPDELSTLNMLERYRELEKRRNNEPGSHFKTRDIKLRNYLDVIYLDEYLKKEKSVIIDETLYYVGKYGTPNQLLNFFIDNNMLDKTIDYILKNSVESDVFIKEVVEKCFMKRQLMTSLCSSLKKAYMSNKLALDLITEVIDFLKSKDAHIDLIQLYELLNDYFQAALQAIQMTKKTDNVETKIEYYNRAVDNLKEHLNNNKDTVIRTRDYHEDSKKVDRASLERLLTLLIFQIRVLNRKKDSKYCLITDEDDIRYRVVQEIIILDGDLALDIIKEYKLKISTVFMEATKEYITNHKFNEFDSLLITLNEWKTRGIISRSGEDFGQLWNNILLQAICLIPLDDEKLVAYVKENIITNFTEISYRMHSYLWIGELENCFFIACELKDHKIIEDIKAKSLETNNTKVLDLIEKYYNN
jgi:hypothetical protein